MSEVHNAKRIIETLFEAMGGSKGAEIKPGVSLLLPEQFSLVITKTSDGAEVAFAPPADLFVSKLWGTINLHGTIQKVIITKERVLAEIDGLPDQSFKVVS